MYLALPLLVVCVFDPSLYNAFWIPKSAVFLGGALLIWVLAIIPGLVARGRGRGYHPPLVWAILGVQTALILATVFSSNLRSSLLGSYWRQMGLIVMLPIYGYGLLGLRLLNPRRSLRTISVVMAWFGSFYALVGLLQRSKGIGWGDFAGRPWGFQGNPDFYAPTMLLAFFPTLSLMTTLFAERRHKWGAAAAVGLLAQGAVIAASMTRGCWMALAFGMFCWLIIVFHKMLRDRRKQIVIGVAAAAVSLAVAVAALEFTTPAMPAYRERLLDKVSSIVTMKSKHGLPNLRLVLWRDSWNLFVENLKDGEICGTGVDNFVRPFMPHKSLELAQISKTVNYDNPHNRFLGVLVKQGIPGLLAYLAFFTIIALSYFRFIRRTKNRSRQLLFLGLATAVAAYAFNLLSIFPTISSLLILLVYAAAMTAAAYPRRAIMTEAPATGDTSLNKRILAKLPDTAWIAIILVVTVFGCIRYWRIWRADRYFETGRKLLVVEKSAAEVDQALRDIRRALEIDPGEAMYVHELLAAAGKRIKYSLAEDDWTRAGQYYNASLATTLKFENQSWSPNILYLNMGVVAYNMGLLDDAAIWLEKAVEQDNWCFHAHTALSEVYYFKYHHPAAGEEKDFEDLVAAFNHAYATSTLILRFAQYWDKKALHNTLKYGLEIYDVNHDPKILALLLDTLGEYVHYYTSPGWPRRMLEATENTPYHDDARAAELYRRMRVVTVDKKIDNQGKAVKIDQVIEQINAIPGDSEFRTRLVEKAELLKRKYE